MFLSNRENNGTNQQQYPATWISYVDYFDNSDDNEKEATNFREIKRKIKKMFLYSFDAAA